MRVKLDPLFGAVPAEAGNLEIVGVFQRRFEEQAWPTVWPSSGVIRWANGKIETETIWIDEHLQQCGDFHSRWSWFPRTMRGNFFNLSLFWWPNYYHWLCDVLPRLHTVLERLTPDVRMLLPQRMSPFHWRTLELLGVPLARCVQHAGRRPWKIERLHYASPVAMTGDHEPHSLSWMRARLLAGCLGKEEVPNAGRRLYISRRRAVSRRIVNETELLPLLQQHGFEVIEPESLSFEEQVRAFSGAAVIVGPHGAGLTNMLWAGRGAKVFEVFEPGSVRRCYWSLAQALGHAYACGVGEAVPNAGAEPNLHVRADTFASALHNLCRGQ